MSEAAGSSEAEGEAAKGSGERGGSRGSFKSVVQNLFEHDRELATASSVLWRTRAEYEQEELGGRGNACLARCSFTQGSNPSTWRNPFVPIRLNLWAKIFVGSVGRSYPLYPRNPWFKGILQKTLKKVLTRSGTLNYRQRFTAKGKKV